MEEELLTDNFGQTRIVKMDTKDSKEKKTLIPIKVVPKKHVMSLMDTLLTLFVVSPLIVGQWQGTWDLMTVYHYAFPPWESFLLGSAFHLSFAIGREGLQSLIQFEDKTWYKIAFAFFIRRLYTYLFAVSCIMSWRGGWIVFDQWMGCEDIKNVTTTSARIILIVTFAITICLVLLRSLRSVLSAPFVIALDTKTTAFDFPTRFKKKISYITFYAIKRNQKSSHKATTFEKQVMDNVSPRPFLNDLRGDLPTGFAPSVPTTTEESFNEINIPIPNVQPEQPQSKPQPNNIQDIIQFITENAHRHKDLPLQNYGSPQVPIIPITQQPMTPKNMFKLFGTVQGHSISKEPPISSLGSISKQPPISNFGSISKQPSTSSLGSISNVGSMLSSPPKTPIRFPQDIFFRYKPQEMSDINLLAPNSFRFAPNSMLTVSKFNPLHVTDNMYHSTKNEPVVQQFYKEPVSQPIYKEPPIQSVYKDSPVILPIFKETPQIRPIANDATLTKPISLTLNVYPWMNDKWTEEKPPKFQGPGLTPRYRYRTKGHRSKSRKPNSEKMVLHLNIYPGVNGVVSQHKEITVV